MFCFHVVNLYIIKLFVFYYLWSIFGGTKCLILFSELPCYIFLIIFSIYYLFYFFRQEHFFVMLFSPECEDGLSGWTPLGGCGDFHIASSVSSMRYEMETFKIIMKCGRELNFISPEP